MKKESKNRKNYFLVFIIALIASYGAGFIGTILSGPQGTNNDWYDSVKPALTPPSFVFPIVWNILFFLIALSIFYSWTSSNKEEKKIIALLYGTDLILNAVWTFLYFNLKDPTLAFIDIIFILITIIALIKVNLKISKKAAYLLIPYLIWVAFASILNFMSI